MSAQRIDADRVSFRIACDWGVSQVQAELIDFDLALHPEPWPTGAGLDTWVSDPATGRRLVSGSTREKALANLNTLVSLAGGAEAFSRWLAYARETES